LRNVRDRLRALYDNRARIDTTAADDHFVAVMELPCGGHV
jgi:hypothetical protein